MAAIKSFTDISQSKKLAEILPLESADAFYSWRELMKDYDSIYVPEEMLISDLEKDDILAWSLAALLDILPEGTRLLKSTNISSVGDVKYHIDCPKGNINKWFDNPVDACYEMIIKLNELNLL
jgi:hypothetical protein